MTGVTRRLNILIVHEAVLRIAIRRMPGVTGDACPRVGIGSLPAC